MQTVLRRMFALRCPKVLITAVLLLAWMGPIRDEYHILEYFAGKARVARSARKMDLKAAALDLSYGDSGAFDMTSAAGFANLICR
ncbi:hypothetical protein AK812_SmicGene47144 [Symbiodinium microadriaticum]|uniref:Uncharacterized protein n=1 Tax=Symbiodinium microadriaticum TaxID=2951 RepID=A0A1Q9BSE1_SYMMI|nr:hypothetical protein AK812_SmicGene47144 [Symbiodinium microadriaticum]